MEIATRRELGELSSIKFWLNWSIKISTFQSNKNYMKSSTTQATHAEMIVKPARFHLTIKNQIIDR